MTKLAWDGTGQRMYETGVDHGVLYIPDNQGVYDNGVAWNGLTAVTESPSGAEATPLYADNIKYLNLISVEEFGATIEAYTYPKEFAEFDGLATPSPGVYVGQQNRRAFGFSYRTRVGNDIEGSDYGYKLHLVYNATAAPSERANTTINDSPEATTLSWEITTTPTPVNDDLKPTSHLIIDSTQVPADDLATLEDLLYGTVGTDPQLPTPAAVLAIFAAGLTTADLGDDDNQPTYNDTTHVVTLPAVTGVVWYINGEEVASGAQPALSVGETAEVEAQPAAGYVLQGNTEWTYDY